jgi:hypothetical protein
MQIQTLKRLIMPSVLTMLLAASSYAQAGRRFTVTIPFDFNVSGKTLPAGQYMVGRSTETSAEGIAVRGLDDGAGVFVLTRGIQTGEKQEQSKLVFRRYGNQYFLGEVWISGRSTGRELPSSRHERELAREIVKHGTNPERVAVIADTR